MIKLKLDDMMWEHRLTITTLAKKTGLSRQRLGELRNKAEVQRGIQFATLDKLCEALGCGVGDILEYVPDGDENEITQGEQLAL